MIESAIAAGVSAPRSRPVGAWSCASHCSTRSGVSFESEQPGGLRQHLARSPLRAEHADVRGHGLCARSRDASDARILLEAMGHAGLRHRWLSDLQAALLAGQL